MKADRVDEVRVTMSMREYRMVARVLRDTDNVDSDYGDEWAQAVDDFLGLVEDDH